MDFSGTFEKVLTGQEAARIGIEQEVGEEEGMLGPGNSGGPHKLSIEREGANVAAAVSLAASDKQEDLQAKDMPFAELEERTQLPFGLGGKGLHGSLTLAHPVSYEKICVSRIRSVQ